MTSVIKVSYEDGDVETFPSKEAAVADILEKFAESGRNPISEVWEERDGRELPLGITWSATLEPI